MADLNKFAILKAEVMKMVRSYCGKDTKERISGLFDSLQNEIANDSVAIGVLTSDKTSQEEEVKRLTALMGTMQKEFEALWQKNGELQKLADANVEKIEKKIEEEAEKIADKVEEEAEKIEQKIEEEEKTESESKSSE